MIPFELARAIQVEIEEGSLFSSSLVSLAERVPTGYRVELHMGGLNPKATEFLQGLAAKYEVGLQIELDPDVHPSRGLRLVFDRPRPLPRPGDGE